MTSVASSCSRVPQIFRFLMKSPFPSIINCRRFSVCHWHSRMFKLNKCDLRLGSYVLTSSLHTTPYHLKRRKTAEERKAQRVIEYSPKSKLPMIDVWKNITFGELAELLNRDVNYVRELFLDELNGGKHTPIEDLKLLQQAIRRSGHRMRVIQKPQDILEDIIDRDIFPRPPPKKSELRPRPPVVTVMGHVDHGKTTLLDALRHSNVVDQEFGGITQHIGAFSVTLQSGARITFLDTPGHAAFTAMRERGANLTDIVVLVVAADDGVMEQTVESIRMARQANVPMIIAINKIDAPNADIDRTQRMLLEHGIQVEQMGGDTQAVPISALKHKNLDKLTEALTVQAELMEIGADPTGPVEAVVVESKVDRLRGKLCTVVVQRGTMKKADILVADTAMAKVRNLKDHDGKILNEVPPGYPAEIEGWRDLPPAGEIVLEVESEKRAREVIRIRERKKSLEQQEKDAVVIAKKEEDHLREYKEKLQLKRKLGRFKLKREGPRKPEIEKGDDHPCLNLVVRADVDGTLEAILDTLDTYDSPVCKMDLVQYGVGDVTLNDVELAEAFNGVIYAFNVNCPKDVKEMADRAGIAIKIFRVIYKLVDDVKEELSKRLPLKEVEEVLGKANVLKQFDINDGRKKIPVAGCRCVEGVLKRSATYRLIRDNQIVYDGALSSMRHLKDEVDIIKKDLECGLQLSDKTVTFQPGDTLVCYIKKMEPQVTDWDPGF